ncbi:MAG: hypothetical protein A3J74_10475 [Elusimicrobia bacterium RIFCSPHIGHO2_02_FULL_57_9]|nr:MAG: hypothetical protein A3J74_10475 [Elusimicrobia bacterium RIFCSPHIGHO2_02_FULL_57_9]
MKKVRMALILAGLGACAQTGSLEAATLAWDAVTTNADGTAITDLGGYRAFRSLASLLGRTTTQVMADASVTKIDVAAPATSLALTGLAAGDTYYFRLTAYDTSGNQSGFNVDAGGLDVQVSTFTPVPSFSACDANKDAAANVVDVQLSVNQALGVASCTADINGDALCNVIDVQRIVNAALGGACVTTP